MEPGDSDNNTSGTRGEISGDGDGNTSDANSSQGKKQPQSDDAQAPLADAPKKLLSNTDYTVGWICALTSEYVAAQEFLDEEHEALPTQVPNDNNDYTLGKVGHHNVVIVVLPCGKYGISPATSVARDMIHSYPNIKIGLMVGIGGGAPSKNHDIRLGDIVVSAPCNGNGGVFQYDFGKTMEDGVFRTTGLLNQPPEFLLTGVNGLKAQYERMGHKLDLAINSILAKNPRLRRKYKRPEPSTDLLYKSEITHPANNDAGCKECCGDDSSKLVSRDERDPDEDNPAIHYGLIASANQVMKNASVRDRLIKERGVLCFEMEAAGLMNQFPCLVIRGICDYSDSHKNNQWQGYAAMAAAAYAKDLLCRIPPAKVKAEKTISEILHALTGVQQGVDRTIRVQNDQAVQAVHNWLTTIDYGPQQSDYLRMRQVGTGQWFLDSNKYQAWLQANNQTLFCPGIPGAGKTTIASIVIDNLTNSFSGDPTVSIVYIYCDFRHRHERNIHDFLASLLKQLSESCPSLPASVKELYHNHIKKRTRPSLEEISRALHSVAAERSRVFLIVDALDECQTSGSCRERLLLEIFDLQKRHGINILATSRLIPEITNQFQGSPQLEIRAQNDDVRSYLNGHLIPERSFLRKNVALQEEIKERIVQAVDGMFLLARLHLYSLMTKTTEYQVRKALKGLATGSEAYNEAYEGVMERIENQNREGRELAKRALVWIVYAERPLRTSELQHALAIDVGDSQHVAEKQPDIEDVMSVCAALVTVDQKSEKVRLSHYTTQQYFEETRTKWFPDAELDIARACITYLSFDAFESGFCQIHEEYRKRLLSYRFYIYAARNWGHHARRASTPCQEVIDFLKQDKKVESSSQALYPRRSGYIRRRKPGITAAHLCGYFGLCAGVRELLLNDGHDINAKDSNGSTPLLLAAENGHEAIIPVLLDRGADIEAKNKFSFTPLLWAAFYGYEAVVQVLLDKGAAIKAKDKNRLTPLLLAAENGHEAIVRLLLNRGANIEAKDKDRLTPLLLAAMKGHKAIVQLLLDRGANIEAKDKDRLTPLLLAAMNGHKAIVQLLLNMGAVIKVKDDNNQTPLSLAAMNGHEDVVQFLLDRGAAIELKDNKNWPPLLLAAMEGHEEVVQLLLDRGAVIEVKNNHNETPLLWAAMKGHEEVVQLLLDRGANIEAKDDKNRTPLSLADGNGHKSVVKLLLKKGGGENDTILSSCILEQGVAEDWESTWTDCSSSSSD